jgi:hypothetical protein
MHFGIKNRGSVAFVFYFILALALLAVAGYYIGLNEQDRLFKDISDKRQKQYDYAANGPSVVEDVGVPNTDVSQDSYIKSLIDSPSVVLNNLRSGSSANSNENNGSTSVPGLDVLIGDGVNGNSEFFASILNSAKNSEYNIKSSGKKNGLNVKLFNGEASGDNCYNTAEKRVCFPYYKLEKIWSLGDLNMDGIDDAIVSVYAQENTLAKNVLINNFYALISGTSTEVENTLLSATSSNSTSTTKLISYSVASFNYGVQPPTVLSVEIMNGSVVVIGNFYASSDVAGKPSLNKVVRYKFDLNTPEGELDGEQNKKIASSLYSIKKVGEATLFKEQRESTSIWYPYNYTVDGLNFSFKAPDSWQRVESFNNNVKVVFKDPGGRSLILETMKIIETCSEYNFNLNDSSSVKVKSSEFIDLGEFGVGLYVKYSIDVNGSDLKQYHADICVTDKNTDKKLFSFYSTTKEDEIPYFSIFDKIWSTFAIKQE